MDRAGLADFLRRRREALQPGDVGLAEGARRRATGLRREEVAALAVMSTDYYTRLEQRRGPQPSEQMLTSLARALRLTSGERSCLIQVARLRYPEGDHARQSRAQVANLRAAYGSMGPHSRAGELVRGLQKLSPEFAGLWDRHEVATRSEDHKTLLHPELGAIEVDCQVLFTEDHSQALLVLTAPPRSEGYEKLQLLAVLGHERFAGQG